MQIIKIKFRRKQLNHVLSLIILESAITCHVCSMGWKFQKLFRYTTLLEALLDTSGHD